MSTVTRTITPEPIYSSLGEDPDLADLVSLFVDEMPERVSRIQTLVELKAWEQLRTFAHQLKGSAGSYGFSQITPFAKDLEFAAAESDVERILPAAAKLVEVCGRTRPGGPGN